MHTPAPPAGKFLSATIKTGFAFFACCLLCLAATGAPRAEEAAAQTESALRDKAGEIESRVNARLENLKSKPAGDFAVAEITNLDSRDYIFTEFRLRDRVSSPGGLSLAKDKARAVTKILVEELQGMGIRTGESGAVAVLRLYDAPQAGEDKAAARLFGVMSHGGAGNDIAWDAVDAN